MFSTTSDMALRTSDLVEPDGQPKKRPASPNLTALVKARKKAYFWQRVRNFTLGAIGLVMFSGVGISLGSLLRMQHLQLPLWIRNMAQF